MASKPSQLLSMDISQQLLFISFFKNLQEKPATTVRFFNRGEFYSVHGSDALFTAQEVFKSSAVIKTLGSGKNTLDYVTLNKNQFEALVRELLLVKHYRVEVYTKASKTASNVWTCEFKGSPGNLSQFEDLLFANSEHESGTTIMAVRPATATDQKTKMVGVALVDTMEQKFFLCEFADDDYFSNLEALVVQHNPRECLIPSDSNSDLEAIKKVIERSNVLVTTRKRSEFSTDDAEQDLSRLIKFEEGQQSSINALSQSKMTTALSALTAIVKYLELCNDEGNFSQFSVQDIPHRRFVHLDSAAVSALGLFPTSGSLSQASNQRHHSVLGLLDHCRTPHGHRLISQWVRQPLRDLAAIVERHDIVELLVNDTELRQSLSQDHLRRIPDLQSLARRLHRRKASMQDCYRIYQALQRFPTLIEVLQASPNTTLEAMIISPLQELYKDTDKFLEMVESTLDMEMVEKGEFLIKAEFDEDLQELRTKMDSYDADIKKSLNKAARDLGLEAGKSIKLESNSQYGYFFRVSMKDEKVIRNMKSYTQLDSKNSGVRFRSEELTDLNSDYQETREQYTKQQESIVAEVIQVAAGYGNTLASLSGVVATLDVLVSLAQAAVSAPVPYVRPVMRDSDSGVFSIKQARHACLEMQDSVSYIANDVDFKQGECTFYMVTGPNMGGKSTYIRSAGVVALMAHIGSLVPCDSAEISVLDSILARVGASDSQVKGMSTFMVEMVETASIIRSATSKSLVIIDELGRGTSTFEGCGIAGAIAEYLSDTAKAFTLFATHFHELTRLCESVPTLANQHVTAVTQDDSLTLLYQVKPGACDQSFGIHVARMAKFPEQVIQDAKRKLAELEDYQSLIKAEDDAKKRKIIQEGEQVMEEVLQECKRLVAQGVPDAELAEAILKLKQQALARDNVYISALLTKA